MRLFLFLFIVLVLALSAHADLTWSALTVEPEVAIDAERVEAEFEFTNDGEQPVTLTTVKTSCGCTVASVRLFEPGVEPGVGERGSGVGEDQVESLTSDITHQPSNIPPPAFPLTIEPGQRGELTAVFTIGSRTGKQTKHVIVRSDDPQKPVTTLTLKATIPVWLKVRPRLVYWSPDEPATTKRVTLEAEDDRPMTILSVTPLAPGITPAPGSEPASEKAPAVTAELETIEEGQRYAVLITPTEPRTPGLTRLQIETTPAPGNQSGSDAEASSVTTGGEAGSDTATDDGTPNTTDTKDTADPPIKTYTITARIMGGPASAASAPSNEATVAAR